MKRIVLCILLLSLGIVLAAGAPQQTEPKTKVSTPDNVQGTVRIINKDASEITVFTLQRVQRTIIYNADTKWGYGTSQKNTPISLDKLKEGYFLNCVGTFQGLKLAATFCYFRETR